jgi:hypothetical protein
MLLCGLLNLDSRLLEQAQTECIRGLRLNAKGRKRTWRKVLEILCNDDGGSTFDRRG